MPTPEFSLPRHIHTGAVLWLSLPVLAWAGLAAFPAQGGPTICPFALMTGVACPGCGLTRAASSLVRGDLVGAWEFHPLVLVALAWAAGAWTLGYLRRRGRRVAVSSRMVGRLLNLTGLALVVTWLIRLFTGTLPPV